MGRKSEVVIKIIAYFESEKDAYLFEKFKIKSYIEKESSLENVVYNDKKQDYISKEEKIKIWNNILRFAKQSESINHIEQIRPYLKQHKLSNKQKGLAFTRTIKGMKNIEKIVKEEGFNPICIWPNNNKKNELSREQFLVREALLKEGKLIEPYDFMIINSAGQEIYDLNDNQFKLIIMNTTNETEQVQALGRIRQDIDLLIYKTKKRGVLYNNINVPEHYLGISLTPDLKNELCKELNILDANGKQVGWKALKKGLIEAGYDIMSKQEMIDGKRIRTDKITLDLQW